MPDVFSGLLAGTFGVLVAVYALIPLFPLLYVIVRWRAAGQGEPGIGYRSGLLYFRSLSLLILVTGISLLFHSLVEDGRMEEMRRTAAGLMAGSGLFLLAHLVVLRRTYIGPIGESSDRVFKGFLLILSGVVSLATLVLVCVVWFQERSDLDDVRAPLVWTGVWGATYLLHARSLSRARAA